MKQVSPFELEKKKIYLFIGKVRSANPYSFITILKYHNKMIKPLNNYYFGESYYGLYKHKNSWSNPSRNTLEVQTYMKAEGIPENCDCSIFELDDDEIVQHVVAEII
jgi:hypothetical protein